MSAETQNVDLLGSFDRTIERMKNEAAAREREGDLLLRDIYIELAEKETKSRNAVAELLEAAQIALNYLPENGLSRERLRCALARAGGAA